MNMHRDSNVVVVTDIPSPYQVQLFNALVSHGLDKLVVYYVRRGDKTRQWRWPEIAHEFHIIEELTTEEDLAFATVDNVDLVVFSHYQHPTMLRLIRTRQKLGRPWCFWGERPGFRNFGIVGRLYRKWKLKTLHYAPVPIWGIGKWAVAGYRREFGHARAYFNVPYHSDLSRFKPLRAHRCAGLRRRRFLYSGSLIKRKGVDLLANAFLRLADEFPHVEALIFWALGQKRLNVRNAVVILTSIVAIVYVLEVMLEYRKVGLSEFVEAGPTEVQFNRLHVDDNFYRLAQVVQIVPEEHPYVYHKQVVYALVRPVPRVFWQGKPTNPGFDIAQFTGVRDVSLSTSVIAEWYLIGGFIVVFLGGWLYGQLARMGNRLLASADQIAPRLLYSLFAMMLFAGLRSMIELVLMSYMILAWLAGWWFVARRRLRQQVMARYREY